MSDDRAAPRMSRSAVLLGATVAAGLVVTQALAAGEPQANDPPATPAVELTDDSTELRSWTDVLAEATATTGVRLMAGPWRSWAGQTSQPWSATYVSWLLRGNGVAATVDPQVLYDAFQQAGAVGTVPTPGALAFYTAGPPFRVALVTSVTVGYATSVEGDAPISMPAAARFVRRYAVPWDVDVVFGYPTYGP